MNVENLKQLILEGRSTEAAALAIHGLSVNETKFLTDSRKKGALRCSSYDFQSRTLQKVINKVLAENTLSEPTCNYLTSIKSLVFISNNIYKIFRELIKELDKGSFKSYLVSLDSLFWKADFTDEIYGASKIFGLSKEDIASSFSFYFFQANKQGKLNANQLDNVDVANIRRKYFLKKLSDFYKIIEFREIEILVDYFDYRVNRRGNEFFIEAPNKDFERSIALGYINYQRQHIADSTSWVLDSISSGKVSLIKTCSDIALKLKDEIFYINDTPAKRITMRFPSSHELAALINEESLFAEEETMINLIKKEIFAELYQIIKVEIYKDLTLLDVIRFQRFFLVLFHALSAYVESNSLTNSKLFWRSILPVFQKNEFIKTLRYFFDQYKAEQFIELMCWDASSNSVFDVQYHPILCIAEWLIIPIGISHSFNLPRNILQSTRYRFDSDDSQDPIGEILENVLRPVSSFVTRALRYQFDDKEGEIDVVAIIEDRMFVFECKNSLHPTNPFELRNSYDYIKKGAKQLSLFVALWEQETFRDYVGTKIQVRNVSRLHACIVTGNRMFCGWKTQGHSIRTIHEMKNFIQSGRISAQLLDIDEKSLISQDISLWREDDFSVEDLIDYIDNDCLHEVYFSSMQERISRTRVGSININQYKYELNVALFLQKLSSKFRLIVS